MNYLNRIRELETENLSLRETIKQLSQSDDELPLIRHRVMKHYGFTPMLAYIVIELAEAKGGFISQYDLLNLRENITVRKTEVDINTLRGYIYRIRKVLGKESIISFNGEGYAMSSETIKQVYKVMYGSV